MTYQRLLITTIIAWTAALHVGASASPGAEPAYEDRETRALVALVDARRRLVPQR